jgi:peptidoglycan/LPS O-acetylase OafA/YrhL/lysophospholipase L1-like esterase
MTEEAPRPHLRHVAGLDGLRAFAVVAVIAGHSGFSWLPGGFYGVDAFFVLSGFLITSLLVNEWQGTRTVSLQRFWVRRARRLLPALFTLIVVMGIVLAAFPSVLHPPDIEGTLATLFYSANWYLIAVHANYFVATGQPSPLLHTWSLAIEEQFYLVWPIVVLLVLRLAPTRLGRPPRRRQRWSVSSAVPVAGHDDQHVTLLKTRGLRRGERSTSGDQRRLEFLFVLAAAGALGSAVWMAVLAPSGSDTTRAYYGTDTRAQALLVGAALATAFARWGPFTRARGRVVSAYLAIAGAFGTALLWWRVSDISSIAFDGGFLLASLAAAAIVCGAVEAPQGIVGTLLAIRPIRALGRISYGVYLWYWPILLAVTAQRLGFGGVPLFLVRVAITVSIAFLSYRLIEQPIRRGGVLASWRGLVATPLGIGASLGAIALATSATVSLAAPITTPPITTPPTSTPPTVAPPTHSATTNPIPPIKVLVVGDSVAGSLAIGLSEEAASYHLQLVNEGAPGCSLGMDQQIKVLFYTLPPGPPCKAGQPDALLAQWRTWVDAYNPDVVLYLARGELFDNEVNGTFVNLGDQSYNEFVTARYLQAADVLGSRGAAVVLATTPYYDSGQQPSGGIWPEDTPRRVVIDNFIINLVVDKDKTTPGTPNVNLLNVNAMVSPDDHYAKVVNGVDTRCSDGVHFTIAGGRALASQILPDLASLGRSHQSSSPGGHWPGTLPKAEPSWYVKLPCD